MPGARRSATYPREGVIVMPIRVGSRLEQLLALRRRVDVEIEQERRAEALRSPGRPEKARAKQRTSSTQVRMADAGVTSLQVKRWAFGVGLIAEVARGRCSAELVEAYIDAQGGTE